MSMDKIILELEPANVNASSMLEVRHCNRSSHRSDPANMPVSGISAVMLQSLPDGPRLVLLVKCLDSESGTGWTLTQRRGGWGPAFKAISASAGVALDNARATQAAQA